MPQHYVRISLCLLAALLCTRAPAQKRILYQSFEDPTEGTLPLETNVPPYGSGGLPTWNAVSQIKGIEAGTDGSLFWAVRDADNPVSDTTVTTLSFDAGEICELTSARFVYDYNVIGYDGGDDFGYELYLDGFLHDRVVLVDGRNGGGVSTPGWLSDTVAIPGTAETARLVLFFDQNGDDVAAVDNLRLLATGSGGSCNRVCGLRLKKPTVNCTDFTAGADALSLSLPYTGAERGARVSIDDFSATIGGDDPALTADGRIEISGLLEGQAYTLSVEGGDCAIEYPIEYPSDQCAPSSLVINEVLAQPREDTNGDGVVSPADEFVEIFNTGLAPVELGGYTLHDASNSGPRFRFPADTRLEGGNSFVVFAGGGAYTRADCDFGIASGFLGLNDDTPERVTLRDPEGKIVAQAAFDDAPEGESLVLHPDGNLAGGYRAHGEVSAAASSVCAQPASLPVELLTFTAIPLGREVRLDWTTAEEYDNERFVVERSKSGVDYEVIGSVAAGEGVYHFIDTEPFPGQNIYRLRQLDLDGTATVYGPVAVRVDSGTIDLYPNPTAGKLYLRGGIDRWEIVTVYTNDGRRLYEGRGPELDLAHLPAGSYYLKLRRSTGTHSLRFIKE